MFWFYYNNTIWLYCKLYYLNTSYVLVLLLFLASQTANTGYLNTSYVLVLRCVFFSTQFANTNLNTSYVLVLPIYPLFGLLNFELFKYILCFGSTVIFVVFFITKNHLNTSYVLVLRHSIYNKRHYSKYLNTSYVLVLHLSTK